MAKRTPEQNEAISKKIAVLKGEGLRQDRAIAAAMRMYKSGELKIPRKAAAKKLPKPSIKAIATIKRAGKVAATAKAISMSRRRTAKSRK